MFPFASIIDDLFDLHGIKFGSFTLKSGSKSPIYIDLRMLVSFPRLLNRLAEALWHKLHSLNFDLICGVPYTTIPLATAISVKYDVPIVLSRKKVKTYGTKKQVEGCYHAKQKCLIIEDVITSGSSLLTTASHLRKEKLLTPYARIVIDRKQGGREAIEKKGIKTFCLFTLEEIIDYLEERRRLDSATAHIIRDFLINSNAPLAGISN